MSTNMRRLSLQIAFTIFACHLFSQQESDMKAHEYYISGFHEKISGEVIAYHSFHPYATTALLTRNTTGEMKIEWLTDSVPSNYPDKIASFIWIGGFSTGTSDGIRYYDLKIDDKPVLTFVTHPGCDTSNWTVNGNNGITLSYRHVWIDHVKDAYGYFLLHVPVNDELKGHPLRLKVTGQKQDDADWYMTFQYHFGESADIRPVQAIMKDQGVLTQAMRLAIDYPSKSGTALITAGSNPSLEVGLHLGINISDLPVPLVNHDTIYNVTISIDGQTPKIQSVHLSPVNKREIYLIHHSHNDIGYTDLQTNILKLQENNIRQAMRLISKTRDYPEAARFRWNVEILWPVDEFLQSCSKEEKNEFYRDVREGSMGLQGLYTNVLTGITRPEELMRITEFSRVLARKTGVPVKSAMISDIPGFTWNIVPALAQSGIRYFSSGPNSSDRIGHSTEAWGDKPFWWVSPSGEEKILFWIAGKGYSMFHYTTHISTNPEFSQKLFNYLDDLKIEGYPYDMVQIRYTVYSDNGPTDSTLSDFVRSWNEKYESPKLVISTSETMFTEFERRYGDQLPAASGDFTPYWEDGAISSAKELGMVRNISERLIQTENLAVILGMKIPKERFYDTWKNVHLFDEHTWGAYNSISDPQNEGVLKQWAIKQGFALKAERESHQLLDSILGKGESKELVEVINTQPWQRTDVIRWKPVLSGPDYQVTDEKGHRVVSQLLSTGEVAFLATEVPALGSAIYRIGTAQKLPVQDGKKNCTELDNEFLHLNVDSARGAIISLRDKRNGKELAGNTKEGGMNSWLYVEGKNPSVSYSLADCKITQTESGPLVNKLSIFCKAEGTQGFTREITVYQGIARVDICNILDKLAVQNKEALYFGFPVALDRAVHRIDLGWGSVIPDVNQLAGACRDFYSGQRWADISNQDAGLTLTINEAPLIEMGQISDELPHNSGPGGWLEKADNKPVFWSYVLNNYWHTNYKASQDGTIEFHYSLIPHGEFIFRDANKQGIERSMPLLVRQGNKNAGSLTSFFCFNTCEVEVSSLSLSEDGKALIIRLHNISANPGYHKIYWNRFRPSAIYCSSLLEEKGVPLTGDIFLPSNGIVTLRCEF